VVGVALVFGRATRTVIACCPLTTALTRCPCASGPFTILVDESVVKVSLLPSFLVSTSWVPDTDATVPATRDSPAGNCLPFAGLAGTEVDGAGELTGVSDADEQPASANPATPTRTSAPIIRFSGCVFMTTTVPVRAERRLKRRRGGCRTGPGPVQNRPVSVARILIVEDTEAIRAAVRSALRDSGYEVLARVDGRELEADLNQFRPDLVVLDIMLPGRDGFQLLEVIRRSSSAGVVMLTARDGVPDRLRGLEGGADDYVLKPFVLAELVARVGAVLRRLGRTPSAVQIGDLLVDADSGVVLYSGSTVDVTATELRLLCYLAAQRGRVVSKTQILTSVWGYEDYDPNLVEVHVSALRRKLEAHGPRLLHTVRGLGYVLRASAT
jgi:two-component system, OmpR family, response regulator